MFDYKKFCEKNPYYGGRDIKYNDNRRDNHKRLEKIDLVPDKKEWRQTSYSNWLSLP